MPCKLQSSRKRNCTSMWGWDHIHSSKVTFFIIAHFCWSNFRQLLQVWDIHKVLINMTSSLLVLVFSLDLLMVRKIRNQQSFGALKSVLKPHICLVLITTWFLTEVQASKYTASQKVVIKWRLIEMRKFVASRRFKKDFNNDFHCYFVKYCLPIKVPRSGELLTPLQTFSIHQEK